jgi:hypothetical protein
VQATERHPYAVAWIDYLNGRAPRGIILSADFTDDDKKNYAPWLPTNRRPLRLIAPVFNALSQSVFNHLFYNKHKLMPESVQELRPFLFPWDNIPNFNELYGPQGFYEYQACVPEEAAERFFAELSHLLLEARSDMPVYFAAFKRMGETEGIMSYPFKGYSFLIDVKATDKAEIYLDRLDALVCDCGGRVNLAKDARLSAESCKKMYKQTDTFLSVVERFNKPALQASAMARRFGWSR